MSLLWTVVILVAIWLICGFIASGFGYAYWQRHYPDCADADRRDDARFALMVGLTCGWGGLLEELFGRRLSGLRGTHYGWLMPGRKP